MLLKNIKKITIAEALEMTKKGFYFIIRDGEIKGFTK